MGNRLRIAIQKKGKLSEGCIELLKKCGLKIYESKRQYLYRIQEMPLDILFVRDDDIMTFIEEGVCDLGIIGENVYKEAKIEYDNKFHSEILMPLGFSKCRLSIAVPDSMNYTGPQSLQGLKIATSYPCILNQFLQKNGINADIITIEGSVEIAPLLKIADVICDIVSTGATLEANRLVEVETIIDSEALLVGRAKDLSDEKKAILKKLLSRISGVISAKESKYVMLNAPKSKLKDITDLLPGADCPTIIPLENCDKVAVHAVCSEPVFWETMENLKKAGATAILVMSIEKMLR